MAWTITIPDFIPARVNDLYSGHWTKRRALKKNDAEIIGGYALKAGVPKATGKRRVSLTITLTPKMRGHDPDAFFKSVLDSLVHCCVLAEDNSRACELGPVTFERGKRKQTVITVEDI